MLSLVSFFLVILPILNLPVLTYFSSGGFLAGLIIPKDNGFAISVVEKVEDFVCLLLLPQVNLLFFISPHVESHSCSDSYI